MNYWLMKSEPTSYSIDDLERDKETYWDGVRNYQARNFMRDDMKKGDLVFFYHSNAKEIGIMGVAEVVREAYDDFTALDPHDHHYDPKSTPENPRWVMVDIKFRRKFKSAITLEQLKANPKLKEMLVLRKGNRLSITPVTKKDWNCVLAMVE